MRSTKTLRWHREAGSGIKSSPATSPGTRAARPDTRSNVMNWVAPIVEEICVGMEVTSYESADLDVLF